MEEKLKVKGIILDLDGTIVDSTEAYLEAAKAAFAPLEQTVNMELAMEIPRRLEQNLPIGNITKGTDTQKFLDAYLHAYYEATPRRTKMIPTTPETLEELSRKAKLAIMTMRRVPREAVEEELREFGLTQYIQLVVTGLDNPHPKQSPEALIECARELGLQTSECAIVGDSVVDIRIGRSVGAKTVAVLSGIFTDAELRKERPDLILKNISELPNFLE